MADTFNIGRVFTPLPRAIWLIEVTGAFLAWLEGATVLDPTCGEGAFLEAFVALARREGIRITREALARRSASAGPGRAPARTRTPR